MGSASCLAASEAGDRARRRPFGVRARHHGCADSRDGRVSLTFLERRSRAMRVPAKTPGNAGRFVSEWAKHQPFKHVLMKLLRSEPFSFLPLASALQAFILSCCDILPLGSAGAVEVDAVVVLPFRQSLMNCLCASPFMPFDCVLHVAIFCWDELIGLAAVLLAAKAGVAARAASDRASASIVERIRMMTLLRGDRPMPAARLYACASV